MDFIREATKEDLARVEKLFLQYMSEEYTFPSNRAKIVDPNISPQPYIDFFRGLLTVEPHRLLVPENGGRIVGFAYGSISEQPPVFIHSKRGSIQGLYVEPDSRGRGIGKSLVENLLRWFKEAGAGEILCVSSAGNDVSLSLFRNLGFKDDRHGLRLKIGD